MFTVSSLPMPKQIQTTKESVIVRFHTTKGSAIMRSHTTSFEVASFHTKGSVTGFLTTDSVLCFRTIVGSVKNTDFIFVVHFFARATIRIAR